MSKKKNYQKAISAALLVCVLLGALQTSLRAEAASTKTMYVVTKIVATTASGKGVFRYKYNGDGLLSSYNENSQWVGKRSEKYRYDVNGNMLSREGGFGYDTHTSTYEDGKLVKIETTIGTDYKSTESFTWEDNRIVQSNMIVVETNSDGSSSEHYGTASYSYNTKGYVKTYESDNVIYGDEYHSHSKWTYDAKGNVKMRTGTSSGVDYKKKNTNTYSNGRLTKRVEKTFDLVNGTVNKKAVSKYNYTYTYKKVNVPSKYVDKVIGQQHCIVAYSYSSSGALPLEAF